MNTVSLVGRLVADPKAYNANSGAVIMNFTIACDRRFKSEGQPEADFIQCKAFGKTGEFIEKWFHKGEKIGVIGRIQTGKHEKDGQTHYTTEVIAEAAEFVESKSASNGGGQQQQAPHGGTGDDFMNIPDTIDENLPFA